MSRLHDEASLTS